MHNQKRGIWVVFVALTLLLFVPNSHATHFYSATLSELVKGSDFVFVGEVAKVRRTFLGYRRTTLKILEPVKGNTPSDLAGC